MREYASVLAYIHEHHRAVVEGVVAGILFIAALSLSGSSGSTQQVANDPVRRVASEVGGGLTQEALRRLSQPMSLYARASAESISTGALPWTPAGVVGWEIYDMAHPPSLVRTNLSFEEARIFNALVAPSSQPIPSLAPFVLPDSGSERDRALLCLTQAVYYESGFESGEGQQAVAQVILNRLRHPAYPKSVCGVVYQGSQRTTGCQFSFTCDGSLARVPGMDAWNRSKAVAEQALAGFVYKPIGTATHYHADYVFPYWAVTLVKLRQIGAHIFYRMTGPAGAPDGFGGRYAGGESVLDPSILQGGDARTPDAPSAITADPAAAAAAPVEPPRMVTLTIGGVTRTYAVGSFGEPPMPGAAAPAANPDIPLVPGPGAEPIGVLTPTRRAPTPEEIRIVNEGLKKFEQEQAAKKTPAPAPAPPAQRRPAPPATTPMRPLGGGTF